MQSHTYRHLTKYMQIINHLDIVLKSILINIEYYPPYFMGVTLFIEYFIVSLLVLVSNVIVNQI